MAQNRLEVRERSQALQGQVLEVEGGGVLFFLFVVPTKVMGN